MRQMKQAFINLIFYSCNFCAVFSSKKVPTFHVRAPIVFQSLFCKKQTKSWVNPSVYTLLSDSENWVAKVRKPRHKQCFTDPKKKLWPSSFSIFQSLPQTNTVFSSFNFFLNMSTIYFLVLLLHQSPSLLQLHFLSCLFKLFVLKHFIIFPVIITAL